MQKGHLHWFDLFSILYIISNDVHLSWHQGLENGFMTDVIKKDNMKENLFIGLPSK